MRVGIDVRYLSHGLVGGVHTYVKNFVPALLSLSLDHDIYLYADTKHPLELSSLPGNVTLRRLPWRGPLSTVWNDLFIRQQMAEDYLDVVHFPANYGFGPPGARTVITIHDAINLLPLTEIFRGHPKAPRTLAMMTYLHWATIAAVRHAALILTVSSHARQEIADSGYVAKERIISVPHAPTPDLRRINDSEVLDDVRRRHGIIRPFVLADAIKNPAVLVRAWERLPISFRDRYQIVFFSRRRDPPPVVGEAVSKGFARLLILPDREDLIALFSMAKAFVFPSLIEGFGIPILEAMTCGAPVIASDRGAIPEVLGIAGLLTDAEDADTLALHLSAVLNDPIVAERLRTLGYARASQFTWERTATTILETYSQALDSISHKQPLPR